MSETSSHITQVDVKLEVNPPRCSLCDSPCNFVVHLNSHNLRSMNFRPVLNYDGKKESFNRASNAYHILGDDLSTFDNIVKAVKEIVYECLGLEKKLPMDQLLYIAECIEKSKKTLLLGEGTIRHYLEANIVIRSTYMREYILPLDALVQVKFNEDNGYTESDRCAVCLEGFAKGPGRDEEVYKTCCSHMFHCGCIGEWLTKKGDCPLCRFSFFPPDSGQDNDSDGSLTESSTDVL